jgi:hypothetical protein
MHGGRLLSLVLTAAIFILQGGDCVSQFFADKQAHDCCRKGHCSPKNQDPCCQASSKSTVASYLAKEKAPVVDLAALQALPGWTAPVSFVPVDAGLGFRLTSSPSPPGRLGNFSLPLLV